jgi:hypothetical protein
LERKKATPPNNKWAVYRYVKRKGAESGRDIENVGVGSSPDDAKGGDGEFG